MRRSCFRRRRRSVVVGPVIGRQITLQGHAQAVAHTAAAASMSARLALQGCSDQRVAWLGCVDGFHGASVESAGQTKRPGCLRIPGRWPHESMTTHMASTPPSAGDVIATCARRRFTARCGECALRWAMNNVVMRLRGWMSCANDKDRLLFVKRSQRQRLSGATSLRARCQSALSSAGAAAGALGVASASPSRSSSRMRARSGWRR